MKGRRQDNNHMVVAHLSVPSDFMIVSLPDDAAFTICCSTDLFILALSAYIAIQLGAVGDQKNGNGKDLPCAWRPA